MRRLMWSLGAVVLAAVVVAAPAAAQGFAPSSAVPDADPRSGRFINLTRGLVSLGEAGTHLEIEVPASEAQVKIAVFDGDMGGKWDPVSPPGAAPDPVRYTLYADPDGNASTAHVVGFWRSDEAPMQDDAWGVVSFDQEVAAQTGAGTYRYNLVMEWAGTAVSDEQNNVKVASNGLVYLLKGSTYGFIGYGPQDPAPGMFPNTTFDGSWRFVLGLLEPATELVFWDGDFDRRGDTDDPDTDPYPPFPYAPTTVAERANEGVPVDDAVEGSPLRNPPSIWYAINGPSGLLATNDNPSGNREWERFRVTGDLPAGIYTWDIAGSDGRNTLFIHPEFNACTGAVVGDRVWLDSNRNGVQDQDEPGVEGVTVTLYAAGSNSAVAVTTTGADGLYLIGGLVPGDYYVVFAAPGLHAFTTQDQGGDDTLDSDADPTTGRTAIFTLAAGEVDLTWDAGLIGGAAVGDRVWLDSNRNGVQDQGEPGVPNVKVTLLDAAGNSAAETTTGADGYYLFDAVLPGEYRIAFDVPQQFGLTARDQGGDDAADSDADPATGQTGLFALEQGEIDRTWDAGLVYGAVGDLVWQDRNRNGVQDQGEPGVPGVKVTLLDAAGNTVAETTTGPDGRYLFDGLLPGDYRIVFGVPARQALTAPNQGGDDALDSDADPMTASTPVFSLGAGRVDLTWDAGLVGCFTTYTQGGWGSKPCGRNPGALLSKYYEQIYPHGVAIGLGCKRIKFSGNCLGRLAIMLFLPQGGKPGSLRRSYCNPVCRTEAGVFAGQVLALRFNVDFSAAGVTAVGLGDLRVASGALEGWTVAQVLDLANKVLGGDTGALPAGLSLSELNDIVTAINENYDGGTVDKGFLK